MQARQQTSLGYAFAAAAIGGAACGLLAWKGFLVLSALASAALLGWLALRIAGVVPSAVHARPGPMGWSPYDRRRSGRPRLGLRAWRRLRARRRRPVADAPPLFAPRPTPLPPSPGDRGRWRERGAR